MTNLGFLIFYALALPLTYLLPYFGSNSYAQKALGAVVQGASGFPVLSMSFVWTALHCGALAVCIIAAWARGRSNGKTWLIALPIVAAMFDLMPILNMIPLVPTVLHIIVLVVGFTEPQTPVDEDKIPTSRTVLTLVGVTVLASALTAGGLAGYSMFSAAQAAKAAEKRQAEERAERARQEEVRRAKEAELRAREAEELARKEQEKAQAEEKFRALETEAKAAYDKAESLLTPLDGAAMNKKIIAFANELNKNNAAGAAATLKIPLLWVNGASQDVVNGKGLSEVRVASLNVEPGRFKFEPVYASFDRTQAPTGFKNESKSPVVAVRFAMRLNQQIANNPLPASCLAFNYRVSVNSQGELEFVAQDYARLPGYECRQMGLS